MPTPRPSGPPRTAAGLALAGLLATSLVGCRASTSPDDATGPAVSTPAPSAAGTGKASAPAKPQRDRDRDRIEGIRVPADLARTFEDLLDRRATALRARDREAFDAVLGTDASFRTAQDGYFDNLRQLPLSTFAYTLDRASLLREGRSYWVVVDVAMELEGLDTAVVHTPDRFRFSPGPAGRGYRLTSVTDSAWEQATQVLNQPWDMVPIVVRTGPGVLGIFDRASMRGAGRVMRSVQRSIADVRGVVPYPEWPGTVVFYALSSTAFLSGLRNLPGGDPAAVDGVTFTLPSSATDDRVAATRVAFNPTILTTSALQRDRLVRHELTHVAVGEHDDRVPLWLSEGLAEYVSVQPLAPQDRLLDPDALVAARKKRLKNLPEDAEFNDTADVDVNYALSWWVCESLARDYGQSGLFAVLDDLDRPGISVGPELKRLLGTTRAALARRAASLMVRTYRARPGRQQSPSQPPIDPQPPVEPQPTSDSRVGGNSVAP